MTRLEILTRFREENPEITDRVLTDIVLNSWQLIGNQEICARARLIVDQDGTTIETAENDQSFDLTNEIDKFYSIDDYPGGGVTYNDKRLDKTTIAKLDSEALSWRSRASGTPREYYVRGKWLYLDRPVGSDEEDIKIYSVLIADDFDDDNKTPYNQITMYEPYHPGMIFYLTWRAKTKVGKPEDAARAKQEYLDYIQWVRREVGGMKYGPIFLQPKK